MILMIFGLLSKMQYKSRESNETQSLLVKCYLFTKQKPSACPSHKDTLTTLIVGDMYVNRHCVEETKLKKHSPLRPFILWMLFHCNNI